MKAVTFCATMFALCTGIFVQSVLADLNFQKALQMSNYFFECQESGHLSPNNRCPWRGPAHLADGQDVGRDLSGGWYDAGDHWKSNNTMATSAMLLAWSAIEFPQAYEKAHQKDEILNNLRYVCDYFLKCVVDPSPDDTSAYVGYEVYIDVGGKPGPAPGVHSNWASPEVIEGFTIRESLKSTNSYPAADVEPMMAAALASSAIVLNLWGNTSEKHYALQLLKVARKLCIHTNRYYDNFFSNTLSNGQCLAVAPNGNARAISYRDNDPHANIILGLIWLHNAEKEFNTPNYEGLFGKLALEHEQKMFEYSNRNYVWYNNPGSKYPMHLLLISDIDIPQTAKSRMEKAIDDMIKVWVETNPSDPNGVVVSPGGLHYRKNATDNFTISRMLQPSALAIFDVKRRPSKKDAYYNYLKSQADYILGDNPLNKSYMIGFDNDGTGEYLTVAHHRGAYGAWRSFEHFVKTKPFYRPDEVRHTLHGGLLLGNNAPDDSFDGQVMNHKHCETAIYANARFQAVLAGLIADDIGSGGPADDNAFPPEEERNNNTDLYTTDREFFVVAKIIENNSASLKVQVELHNRTRWPARRTGDMSFRCYFKPDNNADISEYSANIGSSNVKSEISGPIAVEGCGAYVEVSFPDDSIGPFVAGNCTQWCNYHQAVFKISAPNANAWDINNDWSYEGLTVEDAIIPHFPVYQNGELVGGEEPPCSPVETKRFASHANIRIGKNVIIHTQGQTIRVTGVQPRARINIYGLDGKIHESGIADNTGTFNGLGTTSDQTGARIVHIIDSNGSQTVPVMLFN